MAPKTATKPASTATRGFSLTPDLVGKPVNTADVQLEQRRVSQKYAPLINALLDMKPGMTLPVKVPADTTIQKFQASVSTTLRKRLDGKIKGGKLSFGKTDDGRLAISIVKA